MSIKKVDWAKIWLLMKIHNYDPIKLISQQPKVPMRWLFSPSSINKGQKESFGLVYYFHAHTLCKDSIMSSISVILGLGEDAYSFQVVTMMLTVQWLVYIFLHLPWAIGVVVALSNYHLRWKSSFSHFFSTSQLC